MIEICQIQIKKYKAYTEIQMTNCNSPDSANDRILPSTNTDTDKNIQIQMTNCNQCDSADDKNCYINTNTEKTLTNDIETIQFFANLTAMHIRAPIKN